MSSNTAGLIARGDGLLQEEERRLQLRDERLAFSSPLRCLVMSSRMPSQKCGCPLVVVH